MGVYFGTFSNRIIRLRSRWAVVPLACVILFVALSAQALNKPPHPVIFVHGINSSADTWGELKSVLTSNGWVFGGSPRWNDGVNGSLVNGVTGVSPGDFYTVSFSDAHGSFFVQGFELSKIVTAVLDTNNLTDAAKRQVILVAHSMGGLAARAYMQGQAISQGGLPAPFGYDIRTLITVGTPNNGSAAAESCIFNRNSVCVLFHPDSIAMHSLIPDSEMLKKLNSGVLPQQAGQHYVSIAVAWSGNWIHVNGPEAWQPGDGIVTADSQDLSKVVSFADPLMHELDSKTFEFDEYWCLASLVGEVHTCETGNLDIRARILSYVLGTKITTLMVRTGETAFAYQTTAPTIKGHAYSQGPLTNAYFQIGLSPSWPNFTIKRTTVSSVKSLKASPGITEISTNLPDNLVAGTTYYYQLVAETGGGSAAGGQTVAGQVHEFTVPMVAGSLLPAPTGLLPVTGVVNQTLTPTLSWNPVATATSYRLMLAQDANALPTDPTDGNCDRCLVDKIIPTASGISYTPAAGILNPGTKYYWQVHARSPTNFGAWRNLDSSGAWIDASNFTTAMPTPATLLPAPIQTAPNDAATGLSTIPTLSWAPVAGAASYRIMIATDPAALTTDPSSANCNACAVNAIVSGGSSSTYAPDLGILAPGTTYYWSIKARSENYYGAWSPVRSFATGAMAPIGIVTEFSVDSFACCLGTTTLPNRITAGPDGNLWYTEDSTIGRITPVGVATTFSAGSSGASIFGITSGPDGNLWFTQYGGGIGRITPAGVVTKFSAGITNWDLRSITTGPDGNLWFTEISHDSPFGKIGRITPAGMVTEFSAGPSGADPTSITAGPDGNLWFTDYLDGRIGRITPTGIVTEFGVGWPSFITAGPDGNLWFIQRFGNLIGRITPGGVVTEFNVGGAADTCRLFITAGPDGNLWFTEGCAPSEDKRIGRMTPAGIVTDLFNVGISTGWEFGGLTAGPDRNLWFTKISSSPSPDNRIGRITSGVGTTSYSLNVSSANGTVTSTPNGINCGANCLASFPLGTSVTLTATADAGMSFTGWSGGGCSGTGTCQVTMHGPTSVHAAFALNTAPGAPVINNIVSGDGSITIVFTAPANNGGNPITGYTVTCSATGHPSQSITGAGSPLTVLGLTNGVAYSCAISANSSSGVGSASTALVPAAPAAPIIGVATAGNSQVSVTFTGPVNIGGLAVSSYTATCNPGAISASGASSPLIVTGLVNGTSYQCFVTATNAIGTSPASASSNSVTPADTFALTVAVVGSGAGTVTSNPSGIDCGTACSFSYNAGTVVTLVATASVRSSFAGWTGACSGTGPCNVTVDTAKSVTATFNLATDIPRLFGISTRAGVLTGDNVMIAGVIIGGPVAKTVVVRARGPSLGVAGALANPTLTLVPADGTPSITNDDWQSASNAAQLHATGFQPSDPRESAIMATLNPGAYTAIVSGVGNTTGIALVEVYELDHPEIPMVGISTRGRVQTGDNVMIAGFVIQGASSQAVVVRARGPSLGVAGALADPSLTLVPADGSPPIVNDDWQSATNAAQLVASGFQPGNAKESAILATLSPGAYTAIVSGVGNTTGVAIVEVYAQ